MDHSSTLKILIAGLENSFLQLHVSWEACWGVSGRKGEGDPGQGLGFQSSCLC